MTSEDMARGHIRRAEIILREAEALYVEKVWNLVVRRSQEAVGLALKGLFRYLGLEIPRVHDLGGLLRQQEERLPASVRTHLERLISISRRLSEEREISFYGDEALDVPAEALYTQSDAETALGDAKFVTKICQNALPAL